MVDPEFWGFKDDAMNILRRDCPGLSDEVLWRRLEDAAGLPIIKTEFKADGTVKEIVEREPPSGGWPVRRRPFASGVSLPKWVFFLSDVRRLGVLINKSTSKPASNQVKRTSVSENDIQNELRPFLEAQYKDLGHLTQPDVWESVKTKFHTKYDVRLVRNVWKQVLRAAGIDPSKRGRRPKLSN